MANCCLFFNNIDQSIDLFLKASHSLSNDSILKKLMKLTSIENPANYDQKPSSSNKRKSINILRGSSQMDSSAIFNNTSIIEIFDKLKSNQNGDEADDETTENCDKNLLSYYLKIIHYYDLNGDIEAAIELVQNALLMFQFDLKSKSTLHCILFKSYMSLEYYEKAHASIISNLDSEWKLTCLKHFISDLCNQNKVSELVGFDYGDLHQDVLRILYERANRADLRTHDYYNIIYSLHLKHKDYLKAAYCMLESATRLKKELNGIQSLKRQEKCYLTCLNLLKLVDKKYAWIARPVNDSKAAYQNPMSVSTGDVKDLNSDVQIIGVEEINRNYKAVYYMIKLSSIIQNQNMIGN